MDGDTTTTASEADQEQPGTAATGAAGDGGGVDAEALAALRTEVSSLQSAKDKLAAAVKDLEQKKASLSAGTQETPATQPEPLSAEGVMALLRRDRELTSAVSQLKDEFSFADEAIFTGYDKFESVEAFRAAAQASHERIKALVEAKTQPQIESAVEAALKPYIERYGRLAAAPAPPDGGAPNTGMPTAEEVKGYSLAQLDAFVAQYGEKALNDLIYSNTTTL